MIKNDTRKVTALVASIMALAGTVSASTIAYTYTGETGGGVLIGLSTATLSGKALVGEFIMTSATPGAQSPLLTYCTDVGVNLAGGAYNYTPETLSSATGVTPVWISGGIQKAASVWEANKATSTTAIQTAGLQLAIWEVLYNSVGTGFSASAFASLSNGGFHVTTSDANTLAAEAYAANLINGSTELPATTDVYWLSPTATNGTLGSYQGLLIQSSTPLGGGTPPSTPDATSTLGLLGIAATALGAARGKFRRSK